MRMHVVGIHAAGHRDNDFVWRMRPGVDDRGCGASGRDWRGGYRCRIQPRAADRMPGGVGGGGRGTRARRLPRSLRHPGRAQLDTAAGVADEKRQARRRLRLAGRRIGTEPRRSRACRPDPVNRRRGGGAHDVLLARRRHRLNGSRRRANRQPCQVRPPGSARRACRAVERSCRVVTDVQLWHR